MPLRFSYCHLFSKYKSIYNNSITCIYFVILNGISNMISLDIPPFKLSRRRVNGGIWVFLGYVLSPLSWWNDALINLPIAYAFAYFVSLFVKNIFVPVMILGYWMTNIVGFFLLHKGGIELLSERRSYTRKDFLRDLLVSVAYTMLIVILLFGGWFELHPGLFAGVNGYWVEGIIEDLGIVSWFV